MFGYSLTTNEYRMEPVWNLGCQSEPDEYKRVEGQKHTVSDWKIAQVEVHEPVLFVLLNIIMEANQKVETVSVETDSYENGWPDEWGGKGTVKNLTCERKSDDKPAAISKIEIQFPMAFLSKRDGEDLKEEDPAHAYIAKIESIFSNLKWRGIEAVNITICERKD